jgi:hypothetical protein
MSVFEEPRKINTSLSRPYKSLPHHDRTHTHTQISLAQHINHTRKSLSPTINMKATTALLFLLCATTFALPTSPGTANTPGATSTVAAFTKYPYNMHTIREELSHVTADLAKRGALLANNNMLTPLQAIDAAIARNNGEQEAGFGHSGQVHYHISNIDWAVARLNAARGQAVRTDVNEIAEETRDEDDVVLKGLFYTPQASNDNFSGKDKFDALRKLALDDSNENTETHDPRDLRGTLDMLEERVRRLEQARGMARDRAAGGQEL